MMSEVDQLQQQIAALQEEEQRLRQLTLEAQISLAQLSKQQGTSLEQVSLKWVQQREREYRDRQGQLLALLERRFELAGELAKAQSQLEQLQRREARPEDDN
jgi:hypothetical protein